VEAVEPVKAVDAGDGEVQKVSGGGAGGLDEEFLGERGACGIGWQVGEGWGRAEGG
jgi:hypothetical protein